MSARFHMSTHVVVTLTNFALHGEFNDRKLCRWASRPSFCFENGISGNRVILTVGGPALSVNCVEWCKICPFRRLCEKLTDAFTIAITALHRAVFCVGNRPQNKLTNTF